MAAMFDGSRKKISDDRYEMFIPFTLDQKQTLNCWHVSLVILMSYYENNIDDLLQLSELMFAIVGYRGIPHVEFRSDILRDFISQVPFSYYPFQTHLNKFYENPPEVDFSEFEFTFEFIYDMLQKYGPIYFHRHIEDRINTHVLLILGVYQRDSHSSYLTYFDPQGGQVKYMSISEFNRIRKKTYLPRLSERQDGDDEIFTSNFLIYDPGSIMKKQHIQSYVSDDSEPMMVHNTRSSVASSNSVATGVVSVFMRSVPDIFEVAREQFSKIAQLQRRVSASAPSPSLEDGAKREASLK